MAHQRLLPSETPAAFKSLSLQKGPARVALGLFTALFETIGSVFGQFGTGAQDKEWREVMDHKNLG